MELEIIMLSEISQVQKDKDCLFSPICGSKTYKINVYIYMIINICVYTHRVREHDCISGSL
jgi:hypothetical protein